MHSHNVHPEIFVAATRGTLEENNEYADADWTNKAELGDIARALFLAKLLEGTRISPFEEN